MVGTLKALISGAAVGGILFMWVDNTIKVFKFARHIISTLAEEEKTLRASCKACVEIAKNIMMMTNTT